MVAFELPANLRQEMAQHEPGSPRRAWLTGLPALVGDLSRRWSLELGRPFQPGGVTSWVAPARDAAGGHVVLKVGWRHYEAEHEADGLRMWAGDGTVRLLDSHSTEQANALLLEACEPGTALSELRPLTAQDAVLAGLLRRLWIEPAPGHPLRPLSTMCDAWADEFDAKHAAAPPRRRLDPGLARAGSELMLSLPRSGQQGTILCTDLHPGNVLAAQREPWLVIDPKPYIGDPTFDPVQHMLNFPDRLAADPAGFAQRMAGLCDLDAERVRQWLFARCVQESPEQPALGAVAAALAR